MKNLFSLTIILTLGALAVTANELSGQFLSQFGDATPGEDAVSFGVVFGQIDPQTRFRDGGGFDGGGLVGATTTFWAHRNLGFQVGVSSTKYGSLSASDGGASIVSGRDPRIWTYTGDLVGRVPLISDGVATVAPFVALGGGWRGYRWEFDPVGGPGARGMDLLWTYALGGEVRFGSLHRLGLRGEFREFRTNFERFGEDLTHTDRVFAVGLLLNF
jgi:hypothetical protein